MVVNTHIFQVASALEAVMGRWGPERAAGKGPREGVAQPEDEEEEELEGAALLSVARTAWSASGETEVAEQQV